MARGSLILTKYRPEIDGLRALAIIPVVLFHAGFTLFDGGYIGVDIFFVISGYLITIIILSDLGLGKFSLRDFYERRARRILPALFLVLSCSAAAGWLLLSPHDFKDFSASLVSVVFYVSNFFFWQNTNYFGSNTELQPLIHTWSLAVEEQFYLVFPALTLIIWKYAKKWLFSILLTILVISLISAQALISTDSEATFYLLPTRAWELLIGSLTAVILTKRSPIMPGKKMTSALGWLGLAMVLFALFTFDESTAVPGVITLIPVLGTAMILLFSSPGTILSGLLSTKPLVSIGLISYSAYLWHQPLLAFSRVWGLGEPSPLFLLGLVVLTFSLAYLSWRFVEKPFRNRELISRNSVLRFSIWGSVLLILTGLLLPVFHGEKFSIKQNQLFSTLTSSPKRNSCHQGQVEAALDSTVCKYFFGNSDIAVVGNSHAVEIAFSVAKEIQNQKRGISQYTISGCTHNYQISSEKSTICYRWHDFVLNKIKSEPKIKTVILSYRNEKYLNQTRYRNALIRFIEAFQSIDKRVILILQAPILKSSISNYITKSPDSNLNRIKGLTHQEWDNIYLGKRKLISSLSKETVVIDPADIFCNSIDCFASINGRALYFDDHHMTLFGSKLIARAIKPHINQ